MPTTYGGIPSNVVLAGTALGINNSIAGNPTTIVCSSAHNLMSGDVVDIYNHSTNTGANCIQKTITVVNSTTFTIPVDTTGYTNGGVTGLVQPYAYVNNRAQIPSGGDPYRAATFAPGFAVNMDTSSFLLTQQSIYRLVLGFSSTVNQDPNYTDNWAYVPNNEGATLTTMKPVTLSNQTTPYGSLLGGFLNNSIAVASNDILELTFDFTYQYYGSVAGLSNQNLYFQLNYAYYVFGFGGSPTFQRMPYSGLSLLTNIITDVGNVQRICTIADHVSMNVVFPIPGPPQGHGTNDTTGLFDVQLYSGQLYGNLGDVAVQLNGDAVLGIKQWRQNKIQQD